MVRATEALLVLRTWYVVPLFLKKKDRLILTHLGLESHFGDKPLKFTIVCPRNGTAVLNGYLDLE